MEEADEPSAEIIEFAPVGELPASANADDDDALPPPEVVTVGEVSMPADLYAVSSTRRRGTLRRWSADFRCCSSIRDSCPPRKWCGRVTRCAASTAPVVSVDRVDSPGARALPVRIAAVAAAFADRRPAGAGRRRERAWEFLGRVRERRSFNATDVAIAAEIQQELEAVRGAAAEVPVSEEVTAEPEVADTETVPAAEDLPAIGDVAEPVAVEMVEPDAEEVVEPVSVEVVEPVEVRRWSTG